MSREAVGMWVVLVAVIWQGAGTAVIGTVL